MITAVGLFKQYSNAETALDRLLANGFTIDQITAVVPDSAMPKGGLRGVAGVVPLGAAQNPGADTQPGMVGMHGLIDGTTGRMMPGIGRVYSGGPLVNPVETADTVKADTSDDERDLADMLVDHGVDQEWAEVYAVAVKRGYTLLAVDTEDRLSDVKNIFNQANSADINALRKEFGGTAV